MDLETSTTISPTPPYSPAEERPEQRPASREHRLFSPKLLVESLLIVFSVLLGFAANQWHDRSVERALAAQAIEGFRHEIASNLALLDSVQPKHALMAARLDSIAARGPAGESAFDALVHAMPRGGVSVPPLADAAWQTAVSTGALRLISYDEAALLAETYEIARGSLLQTAARLEERLVSPESFDPTRRAPTLRAYQLLFNELSGQEQYLEGVYRASLRRLGPTRQSASSPQGTSSLSTSPTTP